MLTVGRNQILLILVPCILRLRYDADVTGRNPNTWNFAANSSVTYERSSVSGTICCRLSPCEWCSMIIPRCMSAKRLLLTVWCAHNKLALDWHCAVGFKEANCASAHIRHRITIISTRLGGASQMLCHDPAFEDLMLFLFQPSGI